MQADEILKELRDLKRRLDLAETRLAQVDGRFEFVSGQLRDIQLYLHARFDDADKRFDRLDNRLERIESGMNGIASKMDALPRVVAELVAGRS